MTPELQILLATVLSAGIGLSLGLLGGGGSILALPVLIYVAGVAPATAVGMSLAIVGATSLFAGLLHHRSGNIDRRVAVVFGVTGMLGALGGARLTRLVDERVLLLLFAAVALIAGVWMLIDAADRFFGATEDSDDARPRAVLTATTGLFVGAFTGFLGVGGGFLIVPALVLLTALPMKRAVGTSLMVIAMNSFAGFLGHLEERAIDLPLTALLTLGALLGAVGGHHLASLISNTNLRRGFGAFVMLIAGWVAAKTLFVFG